MKTILVLCFLLLASPSFAQRRSLELDDLALHILLSQGQAMIRSGHDWVLNLSNRQASRANLLVVRDALLAEQRTIDGNIRFANTTNSATGQPYAERRVVIGSEGRPTVISLPYQYVYDPDNPNAIKRGSKKASCRFLRSTWHCSGVGRQRWHRAAGR